MSAPSTADILPAFNESHIDAAAALFAQEIYAAGRPVTPEDVSYIAHVIASQEVILAADDTGELVGAASFTVGRNEATLENLATAPDARGRGHGALLLSQVEAEAAAAGADCLVADVTPGAKQFYLNRGYRPSHKRWHSKDLR